jgi:SP family arabinose:H+ symporter-like MFS transporter
VGFSGTFWIYAVICLFAFLFCLAFVPETKNKSLEDIERHWRQFGGNRSA